MQVYTDGMTKAFLIVYVLVMVAVIVGLDVAFFRHHFWERLIANIAIVLAFGIAYLLFFR